MQCNIATALRLARICAASCIFVALINLVSAHTEPMLSIHESFNAADAVVLVQIDDQEQLATGLARATRKAVA